VAAIHSTAPQANKPAVTPVSKQLLDRDDLSLPATACRSCLPQLRHASALAATALLLQCLLLQQRDLARLHQPCHSGVLDNHHVTRTHLCCLTIWPVRHLQAAETDRQQGLLKLCPGTQPAASDELKPTAPLKRPAAAGALPHTAQHTHYLSLPPVPLTHPCRMYAHHHHHHCSPGRSLPAPCRRRTCSGLVCLAASSPPLSRTASPAGQSPQQETGKAVHTLYERCSTPPATDTLFGTDMLHLHQLAHEARHIHSPRARPNYWARLQAHQGETASPDLPDSSTLLACKILHPACHMNPSTFTAHQ
jgi:hypothetical protein